MKDLDIQCCNGSSKICNFSPGHNFAKRKTKWWPGDFCLMVKTNEPPELGMFTKDIEHEHSYKLCMKHFYMIIITKKQRRVTLRLYRTNLTQSEQVLMEIMNV
jgi:hypothetical protein